MMVEQKMLNSEAATVVQLQWWLSVSFPGAVAIMEVGSGRGVAVGASRQQARPALGRRMFAVKQADALCRLWLWPHDNKFEEGRQRPGPV